MMGQGKRLTSVSDVDVMVTLLGARLLYIETVF